MSDEPMRAAFEAWIRNWHPHQPWYADRHPLDESQYLMEATQRDFPVWQAAWNAAKADVTEFAGGSTEEPLSWNEGLEDSE